MGVCVCRTKLLGLVSVGVWFGIGTNASNAAAVELMGPVRAQGLAVFRSVRGVDRLEGLDVWKLYRSIGPPLELAVQKFPSRSSAVGTFPVRKFAFCPWPTFTFRKINVLSRPS